MQNTLNKTVGQLIKHEALSGIVLFSMCLLAIALENSSMKYLYDMITGFPLSFTIGDWYGKFSLVQIFNDGLMVFFFLLTGLELKREVVSGHLSKLQNISIPVLCAVLGMLLPSLIYLSFNYQDPRGWAIPSATDIAFALGALMILGDRIPKTARIFLLTVAVLDDMGAIIIIALFYTKQISIIPILVAASGIVVLYLMNKRVTSAFYYFIPGLLVWLGLSFSGVHGTIAGVILAAFIPYKRHGAFGLSTLEKLERGLTPVVMWGIMPVFAFLNSGLYLGDISFKDFFNNVTLGIMCGLVIGKPIGICAAAYIGVKAKIGTLPSGLNYKLILGIGSICGIGFTMSMFMGILSFDGLTMHARLGILSASLLSMAIGMGIMYFISRNNAFASTVNRRTPYKKRILNKELNNVNAIVPQS